MMTAGFDRLQIFGGGHAAVDHHRAARAFTGAPLQRAEHLIHRGGIVTIAGKAFVGGGKAVAVEHQPHHHLLAVGPLVARLVALGLRIALGQTLEVGRGEIIEEERVVEVKQAPFACGERGFNLLAARMKLVEVAVKGVVAHRTEVTLQRMFPLVVPNFG
jgi:hypothetical protein